MTDLSSVFATLLEPHNVHLAPSTFHPSKLRDDFLKESYTIVYLPILYHWAPLFTNHCLPRALERPHLPFPHARPLHPLLLPLHRPPTLLPPPQSPLQTLLLIALHSNPAPTPHNLRPRRLRRLLQNPPPRHPRLHHPTLHSRDPPTRSCPQRPKTQKRQVPRREIREVGRWWGSYCSTARG